MDHGTCGIGRGVMGAEKLNGAHGGLQDHVTMTVRPDNPPNKRLMCEKLLGMSSVPTGRAFVVQA